VLRACGIVDARREQLTALGWLVADPIREYVWWTERGRQLPSEGQHPAMSMAYYAGKDLLEVGSGFGCNLLTLGRNGGRRLGLEPVAVYRQLSPILAQREGLAAPQLAAGNAERMPFESEQFDVVSCISAHQYMDIRRAIGEMVRLLRPGGQLQIVGGVLSLRKIALRCIRQPRLGVLKREVLTVANTLTYQCTGRRLYVPAGIGSTSAPIYPSVRHMRRLLERQGLVLKDEWTGPLGPEYCFIAERARSAQTFA
jgi:SAM-dependent methyltransferase